MSEAICQTPFNDSLLLLLQVHLGAQLLNGGCEICLEGRNEVTLADLACLQVVGVKIPQPRHLRTVCVWAFQSERKEIGIHSENNVIPPPRTYYWGDSISSLTPYYFVPHTILPKTSA